MFFRAVLDGLPSWSLRFSFLWPKIPSKSSWPYKLDLEYGRVQVLPVEYGRLEKSGGCTITPAVWSWSSPEGVSGSPIRMAKPKRCSPGPAKLAGFRPLSKHRVENLGDTAQEAAYAGNKRKLATRSGPKDGLDEETAKLLNAIGILQAAMTKSTGAGGWIRLSPPGLRPVSVSASPSGAPAKAQP
jgi:hypothetical protein